MPPLKGVRKINLTLIPVRQRARHHHFRQAQALPGQEVLFSPISLPYLFFYSKVSFSWEFINIIIHWLLLKMK